MTEIIVNLLLPHLLEIVGAGLALVLAWAAARFTRWTGIQIEARHREALHSAIMSGVRAAVSRGLRGEDVVAQAVAHARHSVPDAVAALKPDATTLQNLAAAKASEVAGNR